MKKVKCVFKDICLLALVLGVMNCGVAMAASGNGCDDEDNDFITAELALCSTHAYNINEMQNPTGAGKEEMNNIIAMKTTVITQQMYKQYEQMESMLRRLKTQLEKAVLTTNLQAAGASGGNSDSSDSAFRSENRNVFVAVAGIKDCNSELTSVKVFECLNTNYQTMYNMSNNAAEISTELAQQLAHDYGLMVTACGKTGAEAVNAKIAKGQVGKNQVEVTDCASGKNVRNKKNFQVCFDNYRTHLRSCYEDAVHKERTGNRKEKD